MLSAISLLNQHNGFLSNVAMAQGYDNYNDDNKYSQYPTEVNKYECQNRSI